MKKVILAGASGMVGNLILEECLLNSAISGVISLVRKPSQKEHSKLKEVVVSDFKNYQETKQVFENIDIAFFCIGVYTGQVPDDKFKEITVDYAVNFAKNLKDKSPSAKLCLLSGAGADRTEKSRTAFARYKGIMENTISRLGMEFYAFRPGYIYPVTPRKEPSLIYGVLRRLYPILKLFGSNASITSTDLAKVMFTVGLNGAAEKTLENRDIRKLVNNI